MNQKQKSLRDQFFGSVREIAAAMVQDEIKIGRYEPISIRVDGKWLETVNP